MAPATAGWLGALRAHARTVAPLLIVLPAVYFAVLGSYRATFATLGRDQGIFQYVAWALTKGERDYADIREINGPLIHVIHVVFLKLGGADERVFRTLDFVLSGAVFFFTGSAVAGIGRREGDGLEAPRWSQRALWGMAGWIVLTADYLLYGWWEQGQRESFYDLFLLASLGAQIHGQRAPMKEGSPSRRRVWLMVAGALSALTWFGKPTSILYTVAQAVALLCDPDAKALGRARGVVALAVGCAIGTLPMLVFLFGFGDARAFVQVVFFEVPTLYRFIWNKTVAGSYHAYNNAPRLHYAFATLALAGGLTLSGKLPRRLLPLVLFLLVALAVFFAQGKGFPYHLHPVTASTHFLWLACAAYAAERFTASGGRAVGVVALGGAAVLGYQSMTESRLTDALTNTWYDDARRSGRDSEAFLRHFNGGDFFAWDLRQAAAFLRASTRPEDRVQTYGMDPYLLFLAGRESATPFMYSFELNVDAALEGGEGRRPTPAERAWLEGIAKRNEQDMLARLEVAPPAAFALVDQAPFTFAKDADADFAQHCPDAYAWMVERYREAGRFGVVRVWLRNDIRERRRGEEGAL
jgi:hypothetical protein